MISNLYMNIIYPNQCRQCRRHGEVGCLEVENCNCKNYEEDDEE